MGIRVERAAEELELGDPSLLGMDMSQAAGFWGIEVPIQRRDRKSGARKRSQLQTELDRLARKAG
jgi:DNA (cytosine-5)-methyltransferase 1